MVAVVPAQAAQEAATAAAASGAAAGAAAAAEGGQPPAKRQRTGAPQPHADAAQEAEALFERQMRRVLPGLAVAAQDLGLHVLVQSIGAALYEQNPGHPDRDTNWALGKAAVEGDAAFKVRPVDGAVQQERAPCSACKLGAMITSASTRFAMLSCPKLCPNPACRTTC